MSAPVRSSWRNVCSNYDNLKTKLGRLTWSGLAATWSLPQSACTPLWTLSVTHLGKQMAGWSRMRTARSRMWPTDQPKQIVNKTFKKQAHAITHTNFQGGDPHLWSFPGAGGQHTFSGPGTGTLRSARQQEVMDDLAWVTWVKLQQL